MREGGRENHKTTIVVTNAVPEWRTYLHATHSMASKHADVTRTMTSEHNDSTRGTSSYKERGTLQCFAIHLFSGQSSMAVFAMSSF